MVVSVLLRITEVFRGVKWFPGNDARGWYGSIIGVEWHLYVAMETAACVCVCVCVCDYQLYTPGASSSQCFY